MTETLTVLKNRVENYKSEDINDQEAKMRILAFLNQSDKPFGKEDLTGHITASALVVNIEKTKVLLTHHFKLNKWLQFGGHTEVDEAIEVGALREAQEESGIENLKFLQEEIFDLDVHTIPEYKGLPQHDHYDIRFLLEADDQEPLTVSEESHDVKWIALDQLPNYTSEVSMVRMVSKLRKML